MNNTHQFVQYQDYYNVDISISELTMKLNFAWSLLIINLLNNFQFLLTIMTHNKFDVVSKDTKLNEERISCNDDSHVLDRSNEKLNERYYLCKFDIAIFLYQISYKS